MHVEPHVPQAELERLERGEKDASRAKRLRIVILALTGYTAPAIAMSLGLSRRICQRWVYRFNQDGLEGLKDLRGSEPRSPLTPVQEAQVRRRIEAGPTPEDQVCSLRGLDIQRILSQEFDVWRSLASVYHLLHRLGYSYLRPRPRHRRADPEAQAKFKRELPARLQTLGAEHPGKRLRVYFQDESRFGQQGTTTNVWAQRGSRPTAIRQTEYQYLWVLGAVCPETGHAEGLLSPLPEYQDREHVPPAVLTNHRRGGTRGDDLGRSRLSHQRRAPRTGQRDALAAACLQPRAEPHRESVALPEKPLLGQPRVRRLRRFGASRHDRLAQGGSEFRIDDQRVRRTVRQRR